MTAIHVFQGTAYILLLDSANAGPSKRAAQLHIVGDIWHLADLKKEGLSQNKIKTFDDTDAKDMDRFIQHATKERQCKNGEYDVYQKA